MSAASVDGGQQFGSFSGGNAREWTSFGRRPIVLSRWLDYSLLHMEIKPEMIDVLAKFSNTSSTDLKTEINFLKHLPKSDKPNGISSESIYFWLDWLKTNNSISTYSCFYKTLQLFTIIPVTSCTCERVFSKMTIVK